MKLLSLSICVVIILIVFFSYLAYKNFTGDQKNDNDLEEIKKITSQKRRMTYQRTLTKVKTDF